MISEKVKVWKIIDKNKIQESTELIEIDTDTISFRGQHCYCHPETGNGLELLVKYLSELETARVLFLTKKKAELALERLREKEKQEERMTEVHEKMIVQYQSTKSTSHKGSEGEKTFSEYAETFIDFKGFNIIDKHTQGGEGDFHLNFEEFDVLADAKNYKKKVPVDQREKIKKDLIKNEHIHFGWLVSLNTSIDKFDKSSFKELIGLVEPLQENNKKKQKGGDHSYKHKYLKYKAKYMEMRDVITKFSK